MLWGHVSAQRLALEGMYHFPTLEIESESNWVLPWLMTGWEHRPSQQHNSIWAKYLYRGRTTSLIHNTFIHIEREHREESEGSAQSGTSLHLCWDSLRQALKRRFVRQNETMSFFIYVFGVTLTLWQIGRNPAGGEWTPSLLLLLLLFYYGEMRRGRSVFLI